MEVALLHFPLLESFGKSNEMEGWTCCSAVAVVRKELAVDHILVEVASSSSVVSRMLLTVESIGWACMNSLVEDHWSHCFHFHQLGESTVALKLGTFRPSLSEFGSTKNESTKMDMVHQTEMLQCNSKPHIMVLTSVRKSKCE